jgi:hypothetical protein
MRGGTLEQPSRKHPRVVGELGDWVEFICDGTARSVDVHFWSDEWLYPRGFHPGRAVAYDTWAYICWVDDETWEGDCAAVTIEPGVVRLRRG